MNPSRPRIGVVSNFDTERDMYVCLRPYVAAVAQAGGLPLLLPYLEPSDLPALREMFSGFVLTGGSDFPAALYGGEPHPAMSKVIPERDAFEFALAETLLESDLPLLGICRGMQLINVAAGGTIYAHTLDALPGARDHRDGRPLVDIAHEVRIEPGTRLAEICAAESLSVNSMHHQAIDRLAPGWRVSANAPDGVIEAIEKDRAFFAVGIQWHPEQLAPNDPASRRIFASFIEACRESNARRGVS